MRLNLNYFDLLDTFSSVDWSKLVAYILILPIEYHDNDRLHIRLEMLGYFDSREAVALVDLCQIPEEILELQRGYLIMIKSACQSYSR